MNLLSSSVIQFAELFGGTFWPRPTTEQVGALLPKRSSRLASNHQKLSWHLSQTHFPHKFSDSKWEFWEVYCGVQWKVILDYCDPLGEAELGRSKRRPIPRFQAGEPFIGSKSRLRIWTLWFFQSPEISPLRKPWYIILYNTYCNIRIFQMF
jgi:hypothetical protein